MRISYNLSPNLQLLSPNRYLCRLHEVMACRFPKRHYSTNPIPMYSFPIPFQSHLIIVWACFPLSSAHYWEFKHPMGDKENKTFKVQLVIQNIGVIYGHGRTTVGGDGDANASYTEAVLSLRARSMGPTWGPSGADRNLAIWGVFSCKARWD